MHGMRRQHDAAVKAKVALEAVKEGKTITQIASNPPMVSLSVGGLLENILPPAAATGEIPR